MYETYALVQQYRQPLSLPSSSSLAKTWKSTDEALEGLRKMKKKDLVELFLHCEPPAKSELAFSDGEQDWRYDGYLLDNGPILVRVSGKEAYNIILLTIIIFLLSDFSQWRFSRPSPI